MGSKSTPRAGPTCHVAGGSHESSVWTTKPSGRSSGRKEGGKKGKGTCLQKGSAAGVGQAWPGGPLWFFYLPHQGDDFRMVLHFLVAAHGRGLVHTREEGRKEREKHYSHSMQMMHVVWEDVCPTKSMARTSAQVRDGYAHISTTAKKSPVLKQA